MGHISGESRSQVNCLPETIEEYVGGDNPVRFIDAFVDRLDMVKLGFSKAEIASVGRKPYDPKDLLKLYIWGYFNRVGSSRRLEREAHRNLEVMWLLGRLRPDDKTISEFRRSNASVLKKVFVEFRVLCQNLKLFGEKEVAIDGSKFQASNSKKRNFTQEKLRKKIEEIEHQVDEYLGGLDTNDLQEVKIPRDTAQELKEKIDRLEDYKALLGGLEERSETQVSLTDADSRSMNNGGKRAICFNTQVAADSQHNLIVDFEVTNAANDQEQLLPISKLAKEALGVEELEVLADKGYYNLNQIGECEKANITTYVPAIDLMGSMLTEIPIREYKSDRFLYDSVNDTYTCPEGQVLVHLGGKQRRYGTPACTNCSARARCTNNKKGRIVLRNQNAEALERLQKRMTASPERIKKRGQIVEPIFGIIKRNLGFLGFSLRGKSKVNGEFSLVALAYNLRRVLNLVSLSTLMAQVNAEYG